MRVGDKMVRNLFEASEAIGVPREDLVAPLGLDAARLVRSREAMSWATLVALLTQLSVELDGDVERIRSVGRAMVHVPSYAFLQRLARSMISVRDLYAAGERWLLPANLPDLLFEARFLSEEKLRVRASLPDLVAPSSTYFHVFEGLLSELPSLLGLPRATLTRSQVTGQAMETFLEVPRSSSLLGTLRHGVRAAFFSGEAIEALEQQRRELAEGLDLLQRESVEIHALLDRLPDFVVIQRQGTILWVNASLVRALGYERKSDLVGRAFVDLVPPEFRELVIARSRGEHDEEMPELTEGAILTRDGRSLACELSSPGIVSFGGLPARMLVARDVSERKRLQQRLIAADRLASVGMLAAGVAHEVNNPLAYVLNNIEIASRDVAALGGAAERSRVALGVALEGVDRIRAIVRQLLLLSRGDDAVAGPIDVRSIVESTVALAASEIRRRARLECSYEAVPLALGTQARVGQVLLNLLSNALEAMTGSTETNVLGVNVRLGDDGRVMVEVSDNGAGIPTEHAPRVFDPFFTTKPQGRGTGLGLPISQRLLAEIGGELSFESVPNGGTTFRISLPPSDA